MVSIMEETSNNSEQSNNNFNHNHQNNNNNNNTNSNNIHNNNNNNNNQRANSGNMSSSQQQASNHHQQQQRPGTGSSAISQRAVDIQVPKSLNKSTIDDLAKRTLKLDLNAAATNTKNMDEYTLRSPKSPLSADGRGGRLSHQTSISSQVEAVEDRKTLRDALYQGIFHRHRKTIFAMGSFLRMLRSRNSQYNTIRSTETEDDTR